MRRQSEEGRRRENGEKFVKGEREDNLFFSKVFHSASKKKKSFSFFFILLFCTKGTILLYVPTEIYKVHSANNSKCIFDLNILNQRAQNSGTLP